MCPPINRSILTGLHECTSGLVSIYGHDLSSNLRDIRELTGVCMQQDVLYPYLTVYEHLVMFGRIRGLYCQQLELAVVAIMAKVYLSEKRDTLSSALSGGMKRKLCLGIALIGEPKFLVLDECTSGSK